ncbi:MAG: Ig domain-containing protein [Tropheryma whipplei]|nr:Ig domain-containing protein [Tropheryma whipplei]
MNSVNRFAVSKGDRIFANISFNTVPYPAVRIVYSVSHTIYSYANPSLKARVLLYTQSQSNVSITPILYGSFSISTYVLVDTTGATSGSTGLPKGLSIDATKGEITGSIDTSVTPGEYKVSFYAFASPVATLRIPSYLVTYTFYVLPSNSSSVHALTSPSRACNRKTYCGLIMQNIALDDASTSFTVKAIPNYYDYPSSFKSSFTHSVTLWNYKSTAKSQGRLIKLVV